MHRAQVQVVIPPRVAGVPVILRISEPTALLSSKYPTRRGVVWFASIGSLHIIS